MNAQPKWPPRFSLRMLMLFVLAAAIVFAGFESRRRMQHARNARAEFEHHDESWKLGVIRPEVIIQASQNLLAAEPRQWFSPFEPAIVDSKSSGLPASDDLRHAADLHASEEDHQTAVQRVDALSALIEEMEADTRQTSAVGKQETP